MSNQVGNKNIDNASGQVVRLDIENTIKAVATHNFGSLNQAGTILPCEFVADTSTSPKKLKIRATTGGDVADQTHTPTSQRATFFTVGNLDEENLGLLPKAGGSLSGQVLADSNSPKTSPAIAFVGDTGTGVFRPANNKLGFATAGSERAIIDNFGLNIENQGHIAFREAASNGSNGVTLKAKASLSNDVSLTLPDSVTNGGFLQTDGSGQLSFQIVNGVPTGAIFALPDTQAAGQAGYQSNGIPTGYLECNGSAVSRSTYAALFAVIGSTYGNGNGSSTFNLPDLRGEFIRGYDNGRGVDSGRSLGQFQSAQNASHNHSISLSGTTSNKSLTGSLRKISETFQSGGGTASGVFTKTGGQNAGNTPANVDSSPAAGVDLNVSHDHTFSASGTSGNQGGEARPRSIAMMYIIKV